MPTYEYTCPKCDAKQTETFSIAVELTAPSCPNCETQMARVYSTPAIRFKGDGWAHQEKK